MAKQGKTGLSAEAKASAKIEASAKAIIQRKKTITQVIPPDVTRAKAGAWLTLISPITEWAGLKGDALRYKREQLRIQQEVTLQRIAIELSKRIGNRVIVRPVPTKILVPLLERAALEDSSDRTMIELWANLLAAACGEKSIPPRFVNIVAELNSRQANLFIEIVTKGVDVSEDDITAPVYTMQQEQLTDRLVATFRKQKLSVDDIYDGFMGDLEGPGVAVSDFWVNDYSKSKPSYYLLTSDEYKYVADEIQADLQIIASLGLLRESRVDGRHRAGRADYEVTIRYFVLTVMGLEFFKAVTGLFSD
jgi:Abortive infection alpha